jgi:hypothetical protein
MSQLASHLLVQNLFRDLLHQPECLLEEEVLLLQEVGELLLCQEEVDSQWEEDKLLHHMQEGHQVGILGQPQLQWLLQRGLPHQLPLEEDNLQHNNWY